jgi:Bicoid-interacting protein 3 (Bin3)
MLKENAKSLKLRPVDFRAILLNVGFSFSQTLGPVGEGGNNQFLLLVYSLTIISSGFRRPLDLYKKLNSQ